MELEITPGAAIKALTGMIVEPPEDWELGHPSMVHPYISWHNPKGPEMATKIVRIVGDVSLARIGNPATIQFVPDEASGESWSMTEMRLERVARALWNYLEPHWADRDALALDPSSRQYRSPKMS